MKKFKNFYVKEGEGISQGICDMDTDNSVAMARALERARGWVEVGARGMYNM